MKKTVMLKKNYEFRTVLTRGTCYRGNLIDIYVKKNHQNINRLGIAVGKKAGNSVKRNKIKRLIRENYRLLEENMKIGNSIIILWKKNSDYENFNFYDVKEDCKNLFMKFKIL